MWKQEDPLPEHVGGIVCRVTAATAIILNKWGDNPTVPLAEGSDVLTVLLPGGDVGEVHVTRVAKMLGKEVRRV